VSDNHAKDEAALRSALEQAVYAVLASYTGPLDTGTVARLVVSGANLGLHRWSVSRGVAVEAGEFVIEDRR
jgi:hypothetical protein